MTVQQSTNTKIIGVEKRSLTVYKKTGCGSIYCIFLKNLDNSFYKLLIEGDMAKDTPCGESWMDGVARLVTFSLRRAFKEGNGSLEKGILRQMRGQQCNRCSVATEFSCISAVASCVDTYIKANPKPQK